MPGLSLIHPSSRSLILKIQLNSRNEFQQLLLGPPGPPVAWPRCNVLGNAISAIGALIVSIFYRGGDSIGTFRKCQNICTLPNLVFGVYTCFQVSSFSCFSTSPISPFKLTISQRASQTPGPLKYIQLRK